VIDQPGGDGDRHSRRVHLLSQAGTISITTDAANNQANGTIMVGVNGSHHSAPATATLQLSGTGNGTSVAMSNDPSRQSTLQIDGRTYQINPTTVLQGTSGPSTCTCEFLSYGAWLSSVTDPRNNGKTFVAVGTYVAGTPSVQLPTMGSAIYNGSMVGFATHNGQINGATGSYQNTWDFAHRSGNLNITFDSRSYSGTAQATGGPGSTTFAGNFSGGSRSGSLNGGFFSSPTDAAAYQAGAFSIGGRRYQATGIFAGQR
jgi:hypothetical protein